MRIAHYELRIAFKEVFLWESELAARTSCTTIKSRSITLTKSKRNFSSRRTAVSDNENEQYRENIKTATAWMHNSDSVMVHMTEIMQTLKEKSVDAANSTNVDDDYDAIYRELNACMQEMVSVVNTQVNDRYLFAGQMDLTPPFTLSVDLYERGQAKSLDTNQAAFFKGTDADFNTDLFQLLTLKGENDEVYYLDTDSGNLFTRDRPPIPPFKILSPKGSSAPTKTSKSPITSTTRGF